VDQRLLVEEHRAEFRFGLPSRAARQTWQTLAERFPASELATEALHRLAILQAAEGDLDGAVALLERLVAQFGSDGTSPAPRDSGTIVHSVFRPAPPASRLGIELDALVHKARRMKEMLIACRGDKSRSTTELFGPRTDGTDVLVRPVQILMWLDDADPSYKANLEGIVQSFPDSQAAGYVKVRLAELASPTGRDVERYREAAGALAGQAAGAEASFFLADALQEQSRVVEARETFELLVSTFPSSCWAEAASYRLAALAILQEPLDAASDGKIESG
jgi:hypothetical protein